MVLQNLYPTAQTFAEKLILEPQTLKRLNLTFLSVHTHAHTRTHTHTHTRTHTHTHTRTRTPTHTNLRPMAAVLFEHDVGKGVVFPHVHCSTEVGRTPVVHGVYGWEIHRHWLLGTE